MSMMQPNKITGPNAGGPRRFRIRTSLAARVSQFCRWAKYMRFCIFVAILALYGSRGFSEEPEYPPLLTPPIAKEVVQVENMPDQAPIYIYSTGERKFTCSRDEILHFLTSGKVRPVDHDSTKLWDLAPFTPPRKLTKRELQGFGEIVQTGALSTWGGQQQ